MDGFAGTVATAAGMFAGTNVDDTIVLTVLFLSSRAGGRPRPWQIWAGQSLGIGVFAAGVVLWCPAGSWLGSHKRVIGVVERYGRWLVPAVFIGIGGLIVIESGVLTKVF